MGGWRLLEPGPVEPEPFRDLQTDVVRPADLVVLTVARPLRLRPRAGGAKNIRGVGIPVATVVGRVAEGMSRQEILAAYHHDLGSEHCGIARHGGIPSGKALG